MLKFTIDEKDNKYKCKCRVDWSIIGMELLCICVVLEEFNMKYDTCNRYKRHKWWKRWKPKCE